tara:strand:+ start:255 stop:1283 length:1029 start_codon:yes stop_codon:yes gene_type:complete
MSNRIFLVAGGTGGHLFPAIATSENDLKNDYIFLVDKRTEKYFKKTKKKYHIIVSDKMKKNPIFFPLMLIRIFWGFLQSILLLIKYKPKLIVGFGGYTSIPTVLAGKLLGKRILIHEQNAVLGRTNRLLSLLSENLALTFKRTKFASEKSIFTGIPIRKQKLKITQTSNKRIVLLVIGGSQGASIFSNIIPKIISNLDKKFLRRIIVIQQTREEDIKALSYTYKKIGVKFKLKNFFENIQSEINNAEIVFCRCGSSTLAEIECFKPFPILIPLPTAIDNHQHFNALEFKKRNSCLILDQNNINYEKTSKIVIKHFFKKNIRKSKYDAEKKISLNKVINNMLN